MCIRDSVSTVSSCSLYPVFAVCGLFAVSGLFVARSQRYAFTLSTARAQRECPACAPAEFM
eukprot:1907402-Alexandrium_andersonii.AAC.1